MMRNDIDTNCAKCGDWLTRGQGIVQTRHSRPFPVLCDSCMQEVDDERRDSERFERDGF